MNVEEIFLWKSIFIDNVLFSFFSKKEYIEKQVEELNNCFEKFETKKYSELNLKKNIEIINKFYLNDENWTKKELSSCSLDSDIIVCKNLKKGFNIEEIQKLLFKNKDILIKLINNFNDKTIKIEDRNSNFENIFSLNQSNYFISDVLLYKDDKLFYETDNMFDLVYRNRDFKREIYKTSQLFKINNSNFLHIYNNKRNLFFSKQEEIEGLKNSLIGIRKKYLSQYFSQLNEAIKEKQNINVKQKTDTTTINSINTTEIIKDSNKEIEKGSEKEITKKLGLGAFLKIGKDVEEKEE